MPEALTGLAGELGFKRRDDPAAYSRAWRAKNREKSNEYHRAYYHARKNEPEFAEMRSKSGAAVRRKKKYGIPRAEYEAMVEAQQGRCAICGEVPHDKNLRVDHDHATGKVRGLLCPQCNAGLGNFRDSFTRMQRAFGYLLHHSSCEGST